MVKLLVTEGESLEVGRLTHNGSYWRPLDLLFLNDRQQSCLLKFELNLVYFDFFLYHLLLLLNNLLQLPNIRRFL